jgi:2'-5' RNA ligase
MRLFLAIPLPDGLRAELGHRAAALRTELPRASWVRPEAMHLTMHFFGEREPPRAREIADALAAPVGRHRELELRLGRTGAFPRSRPRVVWIGLGDSPPLMALHSSLRSALDTLGEPLDDRPFRPHLTLARCKERFRREHLERVGAAFEDLAGTAIAALEVVLFDSVLAPEGAQHRVVARLPLADSPPASSDWGHKSADRVLT